VYGRFAESEADRQVRELREQIHRMGGRTSIRDLMRSSRRYNKAEIAESALAALVRNDSGRWETVLPGPKGGHPTRVFQLTDAVDADTTLENSGNDEVVSTSNAAEVEDDQLEEAGEAAPEDANHAVPVGDSEWGEV
jgi:hypothetical protein